MIGILFTGGTISMKLDPAVGGAVPAFGSAEILAQVPGLKDITDIEAEDFARLPGPHVTPEQMWRLARRTASWLERPDVDGLVITHGTDTIEETAFLLDLVLTTDKPVVMVGAIRTSSETGWDGPANLMSAARVAAAPSASGHGVLVVMDDRILPAREVRKVHAESSGSFATPEFGPLGCIDDGAVIFFRRNASPRPQWRDRAAEPGLRVARLEMRVDLIQAFTGMDAAFLDFAIERGSRGLAVIGFGRGNVPPTIVPAIQRAIDAGLLVTISTRSVAGRVSARYGYEGGGLELRRRGAILAGDLSGASARLLQMVTLGFAKDVEEAKALTLAAVS